MAWARGLIDDVIEADWRHPGWWAIAAWLRAGALVPPVAPESLYEAFLTRNEGPRADTFMARPIAAAPAAERIARAVARAEAAVRVITALDGTFPGQALACRIARGTRASRRPLEAPGGVVFVVGARRAFARIGGARDVGDAPDQRDALIAALARFAAGGPAAPPLTPVVGAPDAAVAIALDDLPLGVARHLHRRAWTVDGGPWLGVGEALAPHGRVAVVTTCHLAIDGYAHAQVADVILGDVDAHARDAARTAEAAGAAAFHPCLAPAVDGAIPLEVAWSSLPAAPRLAPATWATGFAIERRVRASWPSADRARARLTPTFQIPVAPGLKDDPLRRRRRVVFGLCAVPMTDGTLISVDALEARLGPWLAREAAAAGILSRLAAASLGAPLPEAIRARLLGSDGHPRRAIPMIEALAGRGSLALLRFPDDERPRGPLIAASGAALVATEDDRRGGVVLSIVEHADGATVTSAGPGAATVLADWLDGLRRATAARR